MQADVCHHSNDTSLTRLRATLRRTGSADKCFTVLTKITPLGTLKTIQICMEYTDAPPQPEIMSWENTMRCPFCGTTLPANATSCTNCDWTLEATKPAEPKASDAMAILLSIIPGLG